MRSRVKRAILLCFGCAAALGMGGLLVAASGVVPVKASSGHWAATEWLLQFAKRRSIATHTVGMKQPVLEPAWLVLKGAGHYEDGCRPCHGSPDIGVPRIPLAMTPRPPDLQTLVPKRNPEELFYVVKHGIKFTGMPAWPAPERDDEVEAVVAFLLELPKLDGASYRRLVDGDVASGGLDPPLGDLDDPPRLPQAVLRNCARCHGEDGLGREQPAFPKLAGQKSEYLFLALVAYADNRRHSGIMGPIAASLGREAWRALADYYSSLRPHTERRPREEPARFDASAIARGEAIARGGIPSQGVPSCMDCHGPSPHRRNPAYPNLAGQYRDFLVLQLELFRQGRRGGSPYAHIMSLVASRLKPEQIRDVTAYYAASSPDADPKGR